MTTKFGLKKIETLLYSKAQNAFRYLERLRRCSRVWRTDERAYRRTDIQTDRLPNVHAR